MKQVLRPLRVAQVTSQLLAAKHLKHQPVWLDVVAKTPPSTDIARRVPPQSPLRHPTGTRKVVRLFRLQKIEYEEDRLRLRFYTEHPWELARPFRVLEDSDGGHIPYDWSHIAQKGRSLDGERCEDIVLLDFGF